MCNSSKRSRVIARHLRWNYCQHSMTFSEIDERQEGSGRNREVSEREDRAAIRWVLTMPDLLTKLERWLYTCTRTIFTLDPRVTLQPDYYVA